MAVTRHQLTAFLDELLRPADINDFCPNGLQVEGSHDINKIITGVTASQALIDEAVRLNANAILVHHGYFWKGEEPALTGMKGKRIRTLIKNDINLLAYHLPIDVHPQYGNNAQLGDIMGLTDLSPLSGVKPNGIIFTGRTTHAMSGEAFRQQLESALGRNVLHEGHPPKDINTVAWCTGGGQGYIEQAIAAGVDAFVTGEVSEQTVHAARELGIHFYAAGHHATERYGVKAVGEWLASELEVNVEFIDIDNPA